MLGVQNNIIRTAFDPVRGIRPLGSRPNFPITGVMILFVRILISALRCLDRLRVLFNRVRM